MRLEDILDAILDEGIENEIKVSIHRNARGYITIVAADNYSEICSVYELFAEKAVYEARQQLEDFVDGLNNGSE